MISIDALVALCAPLERPVLERWIADDWVRPDRRDGEYTFAEIDVARVRLILELRDQMDVNEAALPVVLLLLDQLYDLRRQMRVLGDAFARIAPDEVRRRLASEFTRSAI
jgi:chaperone modulatory protein CbpM